MVVGMVLEGGGAKGGYQIGVWKALRELEIKIGCVTGTSIGAINGALIVQDKFDEAYKLWYNVDSRLVIKDDPEIYQQLINRDIDIKNIQMYFEYVKKIVKQKGLDVEPLRDLIEKEVDERRIRSSNIDFGLVTVSLSDWKPMELYVDDIEEGKIKDYLLASSFLPGFKPQVLDGKKFLDGGFFDNLPINMMAKKGYKEIIAVELNAMALVQPVKNKELVIRRIRPSGDVGRLLEFDKERSRNNLKMGYLDTMKSYGKCQGSAYYLTDIPEESVFFNKLLQVSDEQILSMGKIIGYEAGYPKRIMLEVIVSELCEMLGFDLSMTYGEIVLGALEYLAAATNIERLKIYDYETFLSMILRKCEKAPQKTFDIEFMPSILRRQSLVQKTFKEELLMKWLVMMATQENSAS
ncbi:patatin-like phospholipase family protein [Petrocella sp. FN5]|uniref:patatin-like phospholipase family protein n=1 Tax=Petrocella sp. FN5 TaxID=3032002 RepID=UPI0023DA4938|nr:patatin-like phospholipase family protein [Petrocella sp. FN5]MDF1616739.1 patatin-like phospholipase family protein [Petrocella sp. FN5]